MLFESVKFFYVIVPDRHGKNSYPVIPQAKNLLNIVTLKFLRKIFLHAVDLISKIRLHLSQHEHNNSHIATHPPQEFCSGWILPGNWCDTAIEVHNQYISPGLQARAFLFYPCCQLYEYRIDHIKNK
jgi:hypothetical protein